MKTRIALSALLVVVPIQSRLSAQANGVPSPLPPSCTYDACALRAEESALLQGREGRSVGKLGLFGSVHASNTELWRNDTARGYASSATNAHRGAMLLRLVGLGAEAASYVILGRELNNALNQVNQANANGDENPNIVVNKQNLTLSVGLSVGGFVAFIASNATDGFARRQLARAVWWTNRDLAR